MVPATSARARGVAEPVTIDFNRIIEEIDQRIRKTFAAKSVELPDNIKSFVTEAQDGDEVTILHAAQFPDDAAAQTMFELLNQTKLKPTIRATDWTPAGQIYLINVSLNKRLTDKLMEPMPFKWSDL